MWEVVKKNINLCWKLEIYYVKGTSGILSSRVVDIVEVSKTCIFVKVRTLRYYNQFKYKRWIYQGEDRFVIGQLEIYQG